MIDEKAREIDILIRARYPLIYLISWEERRVLAALREVVARQNKQLFLWSETMGLRPGPVQARPAAAIAGAEEPLAVLEYIRTATSPAVYVLQDFHPFLDMHHPTGSMVVRKLRDLVETLRTSYKTVILLSPTLELPAELEKDITVVDYDLPTVEELAGLLDEVIESVQANQQVDTKLTLAQREAVLKAATGMTLAEAENVFAKCIVKLRRFDVDLIVAEKEQVIRKSGVLEYYHQVEDVANVGGLQVLKEWLAHRTSAFTQKAREFGLPAPKGLLLLGVQGCGKSLVAKAVAGLWKLPLLRLDVGRIFSGLVGSSEENMRRAIKTAEAVSPAVLWVDEIEKGLSGIQSSGSVDAGVTSRVFGTLITWLQEKTAPVFVVATANDVSALPPELLRKGRFDEIFFVDLPGLQERADILVIHLRKRRRDPEAYDLQGLAAKTEGYSGAELEGVVIEGLYRAFAADRDLLQEDLVVAAEETVPLSVTMRDNIEDLREWARLRTRTASAPETRVP